MHIISLENVLHIEREINLNMKVSKNDFKLRKREKRNQGGKLLHERYNKRINQRREKRNLNLKSSALVISQVLGKEGIQTEREKGKKERMKRWGSAQVDVGGWAMWEQVQITPTHAPLVQQPPQAPTSSCSSCSRMACRKARRS